MNIYIYRVCPMNKLNDLIPPKKATSDAQTVKGNVARGLRKPTSRPQSAVRSAHCCWFKPLFKWLLGILRCCVSKTIITRENFVLLSRNRVLRQLPCWGKLMAEIPCPKIWFTSGTRFFVRAKMTLTAKTSLNARQRPFRPKSEVFQGDVELWSTPGC